ncbi:MAG: phenylacetate--CoA ligase [Candidatus Obscuribacterales bacterium]|nr:phenylacetate--CoA ligase [Candidatus Obscuribacterales bacterium]
MWNQQLECISRSELALLQLERLKQVVERVYNNVPFYRERLDKEGLKPESIKTLDDLRRLPFTVKADLRSNYPFGLFSTDVKDISRLHASSGTKGKPTVVGYTKNDLDIWAEACARSLAAAGVHPHDILHNAYGYGLFTGGLGVHYGAERLGAVVVPASGGKTQQQIKLLQDFSPRILSCTPSYALNLAYTMEEMDISPQSLKLEIGIFGAEPWSQQMREQIEKRLHIQALDIYGLSEVMGPGVSVECLEGKQRDGNCGLHVWEDFFLPEIVDAKTGEVLPYGEEGELVFTNLAKEGIPLLRYRTGDISRLNAEPCSCGRTMIRMQRVRARLDDMLIIRGVNLYPSEVEQLLLQIEGLSPNYQLIVEREKALDTLEIHIEVTEDLIGRWGNFEKGQLEMTTLSHHITVLLKENLGLTAGVKLMPPKSVPRSEGKAIRVVDKRRQDRL